MIKISRYNLFQKRDDGSFLAYNATSGALAIMTPENFKVYKNIERKIQNDPNPIFDSQEQELLKQLEYAGFVYYGEYDELDKLYFIHHSARFDNSTIGLVVAPTMACNMACEYCYESNKKGRMDASTVEAILNYIEKCKGSTKDVSISWYGGEPLLAMDIIEDLTESIIDMSEECDFKYSAYIITNGYLLDKKTTDKLVSLKVTGAQITLDGPAELHNKKRPLKNGHTSYRTIIENLSYASTKLNVSVRVNIEQER